jgi:homoserine trans-succinylase
MTDDLAQEIRALRAELETLKAKRQRDGFRIESLEKRTAQLSRDNEYMHRIIETETHRQQNMIKNVVMEVSYLRDSDSNNKLVAFEHTLAGVIGNVDFSAPERLKPVAKTHTT